MLDNAFRLLTCCGRSIARGSQATPLLHGATKDLARARRNKWLSTRRRAREANRWSNESSLRWKGNLRQGKRRLSVVNQPSLDQHALVVVDVQQGFDDPAWGHRNNPACEGNIERLLTTWRRAGRPVVFVRHDSTTSGSPLRPGQPGNDLRPVLTGEPDLLVTKSVNSAFHGAPDLDAWLRGQGIPGVVICGVTTNPCCETTARVAGNLGYDTVFVLDATHTFDRMGPDGGTVDADTLARVTATNLHGEFADVVITDGVA